MAFTRTWDETFPPDTQQANLLGQDIRNSKIDIRERFKAFGAGVIASRETPDATFGDANKGVAYFATDENKLYRWNGSAWVLAHDFGATVFSVGGALINPSAAVNIFVWRAPFACTVTKVSAIQTNGTGTKVNARKNVTLTHLAADLTITNAGTWAISTTIQNGSYAIGDTLEIMYTLIAGTPTEVLVQVDFARA